MADLCGPKRVMVLRILRAAADRTTAPPTRSDPCARSARLNHSHAASAGSARRLRIAAATDDPFAEYSCRRIFGSSRALILPPPPTLIYLLNLLRLICRVSVYSSNGS